MTCSSLYRKQQPAMAKTAVLMQEKNPSSASLMRKILMVGGTVADSQLRCRSTSTGGMSVSALGVALWTV